MNNETQWSQDRREWIVRSEMHERATHGESIPLKLSNMMWMSKNKGSRDSQGADQERKVGVTCGT